VLVAGLLAVIALGWPARAANPEPTAPTLAGADLTAEALAARYASNRARAANSDLAQPGRQLLVFDPRGDGRAVEVFGDLATAERVALVVPGSDTDLTTFDRRDGQPYASPSGGAHAVYQQARQLEPDARIAVIAWLGYDTPETLSIGVANDGRAKAAAGELRRLVGALRRHGATVSLLCHSYGTVVCGHAARRAPVDDVVLFGSPGMPFESAAELGGARVWATRGSTDWIRRVPHLRISVFGHSLGLGTDPVGRGFGARVFDSGAAGHSEYLRPGSESLRRVTQITLGEPAS
jgi:hypothetical protein